MQSQHQTRCPGDMINYVVWTIIYLWIFRCWI